MAFGSETWMSSSSFHLLCRCHLLLPSVTVFGSVCQFRQIQAHLTSSRKCHHQPSPSCPTVAKDNLHPQYILHTRNQYSYRYQSIPARQLEMKPRKSQLRSKHSPSSQSPLPKTPPQFSLRAHRRVHRSPCHRVSCTQMHRVFTGCSSASRCLLRLKRGTLCVADFLPRYQPQQP